MLKNLTIGKKIAFGFVAILTLLLVVSAVAFFGIKSMAEGTKDTIVKSELIENLTRRDIDHLNWIGKVSELLIDDNVTELHVQVNPRKCKLGTWLNSDARKEAEKAVPKLIPIFKEIDAPHSAFHVSAIEIKKYFKQGGPEGMRKAKEVFVTKTKPNIKKVQKLLCQAGEELKTVVDHTNDEVLDSAVFTEALVGALAVAAIAIGAILATIIVRSIVSTLKRIIKSLTQGAEEVNAAAGEVSTASQSMADGASKQAATIEETSASLEEVSSMVKRNAANAKQASEMAKLNSTTVAQARDQAESTQDSAKKGDQNIEVLTEAIDKIKTSSQDTAKIVKTIDEIAFQTNLLALNAAVEAARAGEAGKGFAVVAEEVRSLAQRSAEAAKNTSELIEESVKNAESGVTATNKAADIFKEIGESIAKVTSYVAEVSTSSEEQAKVIAEVTAASEEQAQGVDQINTGVAQLDGVTQANAASAEETASGADQLSIQAEELNKVVGQLEALVSGSDTERSTANADFSYGKQPATNLPASARWERKPPTPTKPAVVKKPISAAEPVTVSSEPQDLIPLDDEKEEIAEF